MTVVIVTVFSVAYLPCLDHRVDRISDQSTMQMLVFESWQKYHTKYLKVVHEAKRLKCDVIIMLISLLLLIHRCVCQ